MGLFIKLVKMSVHLYILSSYLFNFSILYFIAVALTAAVFINERKQGLLDRSLVAGKFLLDFSFVA